MYKKQNLSAGTQGGPQRAEEKGPRELRRRAPES